MMLPLKYYTCTPLTYHKQRIELIVFSNLKQIVIRFMMLYSTSIAECMREVCKERESFHENESFCVVC